MLRSRFALLLFSLASLAAITLTQSGCPVHKWDQEVQDWREKQKVPGAENNAEPKSSAPASSTSGGTMVIPGPSSSPSAPKPTDTKL